MLLDMTDEDITFVTGATQMSIPFPIYLVLITTIAVYMTWLYNNTRGSLIITILAHFAYNLTGFLTGVLGLMPAMRFYMIAGSLLGLTTIAVVIVFGPRYLSKKPVAELPFQRDDLPRKKTKLLNRSGGYPRYRQEDC